MIKGITQEEEKIIKDILKKHNYEFYYYGSRVKGDFQKGSDLDILIKNDEKLSLAELEDINLEFNLSLIPYIVNFSRFSKMDNSFYNLIEKDLVKIEF